MPTVGTTSRPGYVYDQGTDTWIPIGVGPHSHDTDYVTKSTIDAKGDLLAGSANDTVSRLAVGNNGETLVADSSASQGLRWQGLQAAGRNLVVNGAFDNWQRGTSFAQNGATSGYTADRWFGWTETSTNATYSQQTSSLPAGFRYSMRCQRNSGNTGTNAIGISQALETSTSIPMQGQTIVLSYWAKAGANYSPGSSILQVRINSGTGTDQAAASQFGGWTGYAETAPNQAITTTWTRYQATYSVPAGATQLGIRFFFQGTGTAGANDWFEITGIQLEAGSIATPFTRAGGTLAGELAACQRYFRRYIDKMLYQSLTVGFSQGTTRLIGVLNYAMRSAPSCIVSAAGHFYAESGNSGWITVTAVNLFDASSISTSIAFDVSSGLTNGQAGRLASGSSSATLDLSAEL